jgi:hypothetical protein
LAEYEVKTHADLEKINAEVLPLDRVDLCLRPACPKCDLPLGDRRLFVLDGHCWKCQAQMRMAKVEVVGGTTAWEGGLYGAIGHAGFWGRALTEAEVLAAMDYLGGLYE